MEIWKNIRGHEGYQISTHGRVRSFKNNRHGLSDNPHMLKTDINSNGYARVYLGSDHHPLVHKLVGETFIPNPYNYPIVRHKDDNRLNNHVSNLEWGTQADNVQDAIRRNRFVSNIAYAKEAALQKQRKRVIAKSVNDSFVKEYPSMCDAARDLNINAGNISNVLHGRQKKTGGYYFEYANKRSDSY
jgi:hypothetical protein